jgi:hypothetical protein
MDTNENVPKTRTSDDPVIEEEEEEGKYYQNDFPEIFKTFFFRR